MNTANLLTLHSTVLINSTRVNLRRTTLRAVSYTHLDVYKRQHQKLLEEAPSPALDGETRRAMGVAAIKAVRATGYENAGTIEFLLDQDGRFYFMEMNTRVQVEHPVTETITGTDIIKEQLRIASGEPISCADKAPFTPNGHAIEFRINAEDPDYDFRPCPGTITKFKVPGGPGVRVDTYISQGDRISPYYDSKMCIRDRIYLDKKKGFMRRTNRAGGLEGGMTTGMPLIMTAAMKPIPTQIDPLNTVNIDTLEVDKASTERSDVCAVPAASVVAEAEVAFIIAQAYLDKFGSDNMTDIKANIESFKKRIKTMSR